MSSKDVLTKLANIFKVIGEEESKIDNIKLELFKLNKFSPSELFKILDQESKGYISLNNLANLLEELEYEPLFLRHLIHSFDKNNDFCWDYNEFCNFISVSSEDHPLNNSDEGQEILPDPEVLIKCKEIILQELFLIKELGEKINDIKKCNGFTVYDCFNAIDTNKENVVHIENLSNFLKKYKLDTEYVPKIIWRLNSEGGDVLNYDNFEKIFVPFSQIENQESENNRNGERSFKNKNDSLENNNSNDIQIDDEFSNNNKSNNNINVDEVVSNEQDQNMENMERKSVSNREYEYDSRDLNQNKKNEINNSQTFTHFKYGANSNDEEQFNSYKPNTRINENKEDKERNENRKDILTDTKKYLGISSNNDNNFYSHNSYNSIHSHSINNKSLYEGNYESPKNKFNTNSTYTTHSYYDYKNPLDLNNNYVPTKKIETSKFENSSRYEPSYRYTPYINYSRKTNDSIINTQVYNTYVSPSRYNVGSNNFEKRISSPPRNNYSNNFSKIKPTNNFDSFDNSFKPLLSETLYKTTRSPRLLSPYKRTQRVSPYRYRFEDSLRLTSPYRISNYTYRSPYRNVNLDNTSRSPKRLNLNTTILSSNFAYFLARVSILII